MATPDFIARTSRAGGSGVARRFCLSANRGAAHPAPSVNYANAPTNGQPQPAECAAQSAHENGKLKVE